MPTTIYKEGTDLIYEGITTLLFLGLFCLFFCCLEGTDLIYEGITTLIVSALKRSNARINEGTDLIYEGITTAGWESGCMSNHEGTDLIYEGITTVFVVLDPLAELRRN
jgi:hypothetical protein